jgi:hypothetical protein
VVVLVVGGRDGDDDGDGRRAVGATPTAGQTSAAAPTPADGSPSVTGTPAPTRSPSGAASAAGSAAPPPVATPEGSGGPAPTTGPHKTAPAVPIRATGAPARGVTATLSSIRAVTTKATGPNDVVGKGLEVVVRIVNDRDQPVDLTQTVVNVSYGDAPALPNDAGTQIFPTSVGAGRSVEGTFVFRAPEDARSRVTVEVDLGVRYTVVLFRGPAPQA